MRPRFFATTQNNQRCEEPSRCALEDGHATADNTLIAICIATYRRVGCLENLLTALSAQTWDRHRKPALVTVVVENDAAQLAKRLCAERRWKRLNLQYRVEPTPGIARARNRCVGVARAHGATMIAFIDDDELPSPRWLHELLLEQQRSKAAVVAGPVRACYQTPPPRWIARGRFHDSEAVVDRDVGSTFRALFPIFPEAAVPALSGAATGNVLFLASLLDDDAPFDISFDKLGYGEDSLFFRRAIRAGVRLSWAPEAIVHHVISIDRARLGWLTRYAFQTGLCSMVVAQRLGTLPTSVARALLKLGWNLALLPFAPLRSRHRAAFSTLDLVHKIGGVAAATGFRPSFARRAKADELAGPAPVIVISLANSSRAAPLLRALRDQQIPFEVLEATDARALDCRQTEAICDVAKAQTRLGRPLELGEIGCADSHRRAYKLILERGYRSAIVLEEDAILHSRFRHFWLASGRVPQTVGLLSLFAAKGFVSARASRDIGDFTLHRARTFVNGTVAYLIRADAAAALLAAADPITTVADWPANPRSLNHHVALPLPVGHPPEGSIIRARLSETRSGLVPLSRWRRAARFLMAITGVTYALHHKRYMGWRNYVDDELALRLYRHVRPSLVDLSELEVGKRKRAF